MKRKRNKRKSNSLKSSERDSYVGLALGVLLFGEAVALACWLTPVFSVRDMAIAQVVHQPVPVGASNTMTTSPIHGSSIAEPPAGHEVASATIAVSSNSIVVGAKKSPESAPAELDACRDVGFDSLAGFRFDVTDEMLNQSGDALAISFKVAAEIPATIKDLNEKEVAVKGFMLPVSVYHGQATEFLLLKNQGMCCYGTVPKMNEWVTVRMPGAGVKPVMNRLVKVTGTFHVGEMRENHLLTAIYRLDGDKVEVVSQP
jgi:hypothetical protein